MATAVVGIVGGLLTYFSNVAVLVTFTGVLLVVLYGLVALSALVSRFTQRDVTRPYAMPLWPLWPAIGLGGTGLVLTQQTLADIRTCIIIFVVAAVYYVLYLRPRRASHWLMLEPAQGDDEEAEVRAVRADER